MRALRFSKFWLSLGWSLVAAIVYLSLTSTPPAGPDIPQGDKAAHLLGYGLLMFYFCQLYAVGQGRFALGFVLMGTLLEMLQGLGGVRTADTFDALANTAGVLAGWGLGLTPAGAWLQKLAKPKKIE
jgi:hypothetical protein